MLLKLWRAKLLLMRTLLVVITLFYSSVVMYSVVLRYVFNETIIGIEELATYSAVWAYFIGAAYGSYERSQISASLVPAVFPEGRTRDLIQTFATAITLFIALVLTRHVYEYFAWSLKTRPTSLELDVDLVWFHAAVLFGFALMSVYTALELADNLLMLAGRRPLRISCLREREDLR